MQAPMKVQFEDLLHESLSGSEGSILLITHPSHLESGHIVPSPRSRILVDPDIEPARRLKRTVLWKTLPRCNAYLDEESLDHLFSNSDPPRMTTLLDFSTLVAKSPTQPRRALISVLLRDVNVLKLAKANSFFCMPCPKCGSSIFSNRSPENCHDPGCDSLVDLRLNPRILGGFADETAGMLYREEREPGQHESGGVQMKRTRSRRRDDGDEDEETPCQRRPFTSPSPFLITDQACTSLLGITPSAMEEKLDNTHSRLHHPRTYIEDFLQHIEWKLTWARKTMLLVWTGDSTLQGQDQEVGGWDLLEIQRHIVVMDVF